MFGVTARPVRPAGLMIATMTRRKFDPKSRRVGETLASATYVSLRRDIINGALEPGSQLRIRQLCERYGTGFSPIREALNRLLRDGLVTQTDLCGFAVAPLSRAELEEITVTRCWLNELALRQSIKRGDTAWEEGIVLAYHRLGRIAVDAPGVDRPNNAESNEAAHRAFHASLLRACGSSFLLGYCEQLFDLGDRYRRLVKPTTRKERQHDEHQLIMEAALSRDAESAVDLLTRHLLKTAELASRALDDQESGSPGKETRKSVLATAQP